MSREAAILMLGDDCLPTWLDLERAEEKSEKSSSFDVQKENAASSVTAQTIPVAVVEVATTKNPPNFELGKAEQKNSATGLTQAQTREFNGLVCVFLYYVVCVCVCVEMCLH